MLACGHLFHRLCIEKKLLLTVPNTCPFPDCGKNGDILEQADDIGIVFNTYASTEKSSRKKAKTGVTDMLEKFIEELSSGATQVQEVTEEGVGSFFEYNAIVKLEEQAGNVNRDVIKSYFNFGKALTERFDYYRNDNPKRTAQAQVNEEVRKELPDSVSDDSLWKRKEKALSITAI